MWAMHTPYKHFSCSWTLLGFNTRSAFLALSLLTGSYALSAPPHKTTSSATAPALEPIMHLKLPIMLLSSAPKSSLLCSKLCSEIQIMHMLIDTVKFNTIQLKISLTFC